MALLDTELSADHFLETTTNTLQYSMGTVVDFEWKDYYPAVFRTILELDNIKYIEYMQSICGEELLKHIISQGKCGSVFVSSVDSRFVIKMLQRSELKAMLAKLPNYYHHLKTYRASLLSKLYGLHVVRPFGAGKVYFAVMSNEIRSDLKIHRCYDLKGTTKGRNNIKMVAEHISIDKDEDFDFCFYLDPFVRHRLLKQIKYDCEFLEGEGIMDYSFLLSIHVEAQHDDLCNCKRSISCGGSSISRKEMIDDSSEGSEADFTFSYLCKESESTFEKFGTKMPARAMQTKKNGGKGSSSHRRAEEYYDVVLNFGIVDIFKSYDMLKRIEHLYKSVQYDSKSIAAVNPKVYSCRFQDFLSRVFQSEESMSSHAGEGSISSNRD